MKFIEEFRDPHLAARLGESIAAAACTGRSYRFMEFCGGHTHAISRYGLTELLPPNVRMVHGPGCPVCVLPTARIDSAVWLAQLPDVTLCSYGDTLRVPGAQGQSLLRAKAQGADVRVVYSPADALSLAERLPARRVIFFAIGFETTAPATAAVLEQARMRRVENFAVFCNHVLTPSAITNILESPEVRKLPAPSVPLDGFVGPAHVSAVIGTRPYEFFAEEYGKPVVIAGFEPLDILQALLMLLRQVNEGRAEVENEYTRVVTRDGNAKAQGLVARVFELQHEFEWRGLGVVPFSSLRIRAPFRRFDIEAQLVLPQVRGEDHKACACGAVLRGVTEPRDCVLFGTVCTPDNPVGACMVSSEGACAAHYRYRRHPPLKGMTSGEAAGALP